MRAGPTGGDRSAGYYRWVTVIDLEFALRRAAQIVNNFQAAYTGSSYTISSFLPALRTN